MHSISYIVHPEDLTAVVRVVHDALFPSTIRRNGPRSNPFHAVQSDAIHA